MFRGFLSTTTRLRVSFDTTSGFLHLPSTAPSVLSKGSGLAWRSIQPTAAPVLGHFSAAFHAAAAPPSAVMPLSSTQHLTATCVVMFVSALGAGYLPTLIKISEAKFSALGALGAGLLTGTALAVILPEGFHAFQAAQHATDEALPDWTVGAVLVAGFLGMLLLDQLQHRVGGPHAHGHGHVHSHGRGTLHLRNSDDDLEQAATTLPPRMAGKGKQDAASRALIGLLVHSAADGFAVGASSVSTSASLSFLVAVAMVLHKAPVAFGLATYLLSADWAPQRARQALLVFAAASPVVAALTYVAIMAAPGLSSQASIALCVLFSGGTFLYASCIHILPEIIGERQKLSLMELGAVLIGGILPIVFTALHGDHHH